ncbi:MAG TPA: type II toxin-antitoxin system RelE/ParE family toxin [Pirellulaceae bacterium]|nr:type II toxin-antitoxin system RelE/ParE family toxin [Pirellulaceae bacterium]HMO93574.1 type II toxin-antitoxin system RelE/ParE family toxin [Pirellulaceae bacterium]HMP71587.1 type II toxin-antitoxin system RelE/ParE family toxin [Pirellulaceae bacterium]
MTEKYQISVMPRAERDIEAIFSWLLDRSPTGARNWLAALDDALERMSLDPLSFGLAPEAQTVARELRQCLFRTRKGRTYRAIYLFEREVVIVLRIRGPGQPSLESDEVDK